MLNYLGRLNASLKVSCTLWNVNSDKVEGVQGKFMEEEWEKVVAIEMEIYIQYLRNSNRQTNRIHQFNRHIYSWNLHKFRHVWTASSFETKSYLQCSFHFSHRLAQWPAKLLFSVSFPSHILHIVEVHIEWMQCAFGTYYKCRNFPLIRIFISKIICLLIGNSIHF